VTGETLHEAGIAVTTTVPASYVRINAIVETGDSRLRQNGLRKDFFDFHYTYYNGIYIFFVAPSFIGGDPRHLQHSMPTLPVTNDGERIRVRIYQAGRSK
jgi:hypothetical protein